jgi:hypothetical protein
MGEGMMMNPYQILHNPASFHAYLWLAFYSGLMWGAGLASVVSVFWLVRKVAASKRVQASIGANWGAGLGLLLLAALFGLGYLVK